MPKIDKLLETLRWMAWQRAKGALAEMLETYHDGMLFRSQRLRIEMFSGAVENGRPLFTARELEEAFDQGKERGIAIATTSAGGRIAAPSFSNWFGDYLAERNAAEENDAKI